MSNSLLNYFKKSDNSSLSPAPIKKEKQIYSPKLEKENARPKNEPEKMETDIYDDEIVNRPKLDLKAEKLDSPRVKRKRLMIASDSDSEPETKPKTKKKPESSPEYETKSEPDSEDDSFIDDDDEDDPKPKKKSLSSSKKSVNSPKTPKSRSTKSKPETPSSTTKQNLNSFAAASAENDGPIEGKFKHFSYEFLQEDKIK